MKEKDIIDDSKVLDFLEEITNMDAELTENEMLEFTAEEKEKSFDVFKEWILHLLNLDNVTEDRYKQWKDFFIRHGYINEKEEIIYKPLEDK